MKQTENHNCTVVGLGEVLWDVFPTGKKLGGAPSNFAYHVAQFGFESYAVSALGRDALGDGVMAELQDKPMEKFFPRVDFPTGTVQVSLDERGVPSYEIKEGVAWDNIPFTPELEGLARRTRCVCFGSLAQRNEVSRRTIRRFLESMPADESEIKVFDINLRQQFYSQELIEESLQLANVLKLNDDELEVVTPMFALGEGSQSERCRLLLERFGLKLLILTCGTQGSFVFAPAEESFLPTPIVEVVDTVGAGDSFTAGFCSSLLQGKSIAEAHEMAVRLSAFVCTQSGAMPLHDAMRLPVI